MYSDLDNKKSRGGPFGAETPPPPAYEVTVMQELSNFCDYTSAHGLPHVKRVISPVAKAVWACLCLVFLGVLIYEIYVLVHRFRNRDYNVLVEIKFDRKINFPAVTVCNMNAYR